MVVETGHGSGDPVSGSGKVMAVSLNGVVVLEYHRDKTLSPPQKEYLLKLEDSLSAKIELDGRGIEKPDEVQKARYVASHLYEAIKTGNESLMAALTSYLATRIEELKQIKLEENGDNIGIDFVFDRPYVNQQTVSFSPRGDA